MNTRGTETFHLPVYLRRLQGLFLLGLVLALPGQSLAQEAEESAECVILLHGLGRSALSMKAVQWRLTDEGYTVVNQSYPSLSYSIEEMAVIAIEQSVAECPAAAKVNFVTHSLGGILVRQYLSQHQIDALHRVVMLAPPNQGSQLADTIQAIPLVGWLEPQAAGQLVTSANSVPLSLGPVDFELGIIAGTSNWRPYTLGSADDVSDGTVTVAETKVLGMVDFLALPASHSFIMWNGAVLEQLVHFLQQGRFFRSPEISVAD